MIYNACALYLLCLSFFFLTVYDFLRLPVDLFLDLDLLNFVIPLEEEEVSVLAFEMGYDLIRNVRTKLL